jgi:predicted Rossmann-fold nucleotide-binding protein
LIVRACDAVIAIRGGYGTLSEIAFALRLSVPVVGLQTWSVVQNEKADPGIHVVKSPKEAVAMALKLAARAI